MNRKIIISLAIFAVIVSITIPLWVTLHYAASEAEERELDRLYQVNSKIIKHTRKAINEASHVLTYLNLNENTTRQCSSEQIKLLNNLLYNTVNLKEIDVVKDNHIQCNSTGVGR